MIRTIFLPLVMAAIAVTAHVVAGALYRQRRTLVRKDRDLAATLAESVQHQGLLDAVLSTVDVGVWVVDENGQDVLTNRAMRTDPSLARLTSRRRVCEALSRRQDYPRAAGGVPCRAGFPG